MLAKHGWRRVFLPQKQVLARRRLWPRPTSPHHPKKLWPEGEACVVPRPIALKATASMTRLNSESWFFLVPLLALPTSSLHALYRL